MADEILSTLGFKCDDAIAALEKMDQKMNAMAGTFGSLTEAMSDWNASAAPTIECFKAIAEHANNAAAAVAKLNANMRKTGGSGQAAPPPPPPPPEPSKQLWLPPGVKEEIEAIKPPIKQVGEELDKTKAKAGGFTVSLQMLSRIVITQAIVRAISGIRDAISEAITSNMEFQKRISELNSIMAGPKENMDGLKSSVAALAVEFNFPISQVAEAEYQAVSAQFTSTAQRHRHYDRFLEAGQDRLHGTQHGDDPHCRDLEFLRHVVQSGGNRSRQILSDDPGWQGAGRGTCLVPGQGHARGVRVGREH